MMCRDEPIVPIIKWDDGFVNEGMGAKTSARSGDALQNRLYGTFDL